MLVQAPELGLSLSSRGPVLKEEGNRFFVGSDLAVEDKEWVEFWQKMIAPEKVQISLPDSNKKIIVISGPTSVGKTELSFLIAQAVGGEIVSADSMQVYRGMDIGTAKASLEERSRTPHHLIDIRDVDETFNVMDFWKEATEAIEGIFQRGHVPIVVGGTGFYLNALLYGPPGGPPSVEIVRLHWEAELEKNGPLALFEKLKEVDPDYAKTITWNDKHKIVRALEIISLTSKRVSQISRQSVDVHKYNARCWFLHKPRDLLYEGIDKRCEEMVSRGFVDEVRALDLAGLRSNSSASQAIGYRQCLEFLSSNQSQLDMDRFMVLFKQASRRYAKRQFTWFRKEPLFRWLSRDEVSFDRAAEIILQDFELSF